MADINLIQEGKAYIHRQAIKKIDKLEYKNKTRLEIIKKLLPNYEIQKKPEIFHSSDKPDKYLIGGYGCGKTYTGAAEGIFLAWVNRPLPVLVVIQTKSNSEATTEDDLDKICIDNNLEYWTEDDRGGTYRNYYVKFGDDENDIGRFMLASGHVPGNLKGPTVAAAWIDEPFIQPKETVEVVVSRARDHRAVINEVYFTGTIEPDMEYGHEIVDNSYQGDEHTLKVVINTEENKFAPPAFINRMKRHYSPELQKMYIKGENVLLGGKRVYDCITDANVKKFDTFKFKEGFRTMGIGFDFNVGKMCAAEFYLDGKVRKQIDEYSIENSNTRQLCKKIIERLIVKYPGCNSYNRLMYHFLLVPDAASKQRRSSAELNVTDAKIINKAFKDAGINFTLYVPNENPPVYARVDFINEIAQTERYIIYDNCVETINDRKFTKWKKGEGWNIDKSNGRSHMSEAGDYYLFITRLIIEANESESNENFNETQEREERII